MLTKTLPGSANPWQFDYGWLNAYGPNGMSDEYFPEGACYESWTLPKDDPNSFTEVPQRLTDDVGNKVYYAVGVDGTLRHAWFNLSFVGNSVVSYCRTDYFLEGYTGGTYVTRGSLGRVSNLWRWIEGYTWNESVKSQNDYTYYPEGTGLRYSNAISGEIGSTRTETYQYDELYRLTGVNYGDGQTQHYTFDPMGNRLTKTGTGTPSETYVYNNANMLVSRSGQSYTNDANGNTTSGGGRTNAWDSQNRLTQCVYNGHTSTFTYGADGLRRRSVVDTVTTDFVIDGQSVVREMREGNPYATYLAGLRGPEYRRDANGARWYLYDGLGSVIGEIGPSGTLTMARKLDVFGLERDRQPPGAPSSNHRFVGSLGHTTEDEPGGLIYMRARWMDPALGRFISEDPARKGVNWYGYADSDPVDKVDPTGTTAQFWIAWLAAAEALWHTALWYSNTFRPIAERIAAGFITFVRTAQPNDGNAFAIATGTWNSAVFAMTRGINARTIPVEVMGMTAGYTATLMFWMYILFHDESA